MNIIKVSSKSHPASVAGALANLFKTRDEVEIQAIGAGALSNKGCCDCKGLCCTDRS